MKSNLTKLWSELKATIPTSESLYPGLIKKEVIKLHPDLLTLLTLNNGQRIDNPGIFIRPTLDFTSWSWTEFKFLDYDSIINILPTFVRQSYHIMSILEELASGFVTEIFSVAIRYLGASIRWIIFIRKQTFEITLQQRWNTTVGIITIGIVITLLIYSFA
jgi:hypothetical protein